MIEDLGHFEYQGEPAFKHWLFTRARHKIHDRVRFYTAQRRETAREEDRDQSYASVYANLVTPSRIVSGREELDMVERVFDRLPDDYREVIVLSRIIGLSHAEVATRIGRSELATRQLLRRALVRLTGLLRNSS